MWVILIEFFLMNAGICRNLQCKQPAFQEASIVIRASFLRFFEVLNVYEIQIGVPICTIKGLLVVFFKISYFIDVNICHN